MRQPAKMYSRKLDHLTSGARAGAGRRNIAPALLLCLLWQGSIIKFQQELIRELWAGRYRG